MENMELVIFELISNGGEGKALAYDAMRAANEGDFDKAEELLQEADKALKVAHKTQTKIVQEEAAGNAHEVTVLFAHAQDHLMTAIEVRNLAEVIIGMSKKIYDLENK